MKFRLTGGNVIISGGDLVLELEDGQMTVEDVQRMLQNKINERESAKRDEIKNAGATKVTEQSVDTLNPKEKISL